MKGYKIINQIGEGGNGVVYEAIQQSTGQKVAIKTIKLQDGLTGTQSDRKLQRFDREIKLCAKLNHPNIVQVLDCGIDDNSVEKIRGFNGLRLHCTKTHHCKLLA